MKIEARPQRSRSYDIEFSWKEKQILAVDHPSRLEDLAEALWADQIHGVEGIATENTSGTIIVDLLEGEDTQDTINLVMACLQNRLALF